MAKDIKMQKNSDVIVINENNIEHYQKLGYKVFEENKLEEKKTYGDSSWKRGSSKNRK